MDKINAEDFSIAKANKKDFKKAVISRGNLTNEFTLEDIETHEAELAKNKRELEAQVRVTKAVIDNVDRNHAFVSKMSDEALSVASYLFEARQTLKKSEAQLKSVKATQKKYTEVRDMVMKKFGFVEANNSGDESSK